MNQSTRDYLAARLPLGDYASLAFDFATMLSDEQVRAFLRQSRTFAYILGESHPDHPRYMARVAVLTDIARRRGMFALVEEPTIVPV